MDTKHYFRCPLCGRSDVAAIKPRKPIGEWGEGWWVGCLRCEADLSGREYLQQLAEAVDCRAIELLQRADEVLAELLDTDSGRNRQNGALKPLPDAATLEEYAAALQTSNGPLKFLKDRGISSVMAARRSVGLNRGGRLTFPMYDGSDRLVALKTRQPTRHGQMRNIAGQGREWPLYPWPEAEARQPLVVCAGELDALCAVSAGIDACSVTLGASVWRHPWTAAVYLRRVLVCFDNNEARQARRLCDGLTSAGVDARFVSLRRLGLQTPKGDLSDYLLAGGSPANLLKGTK